MVRLFSSIWRRRPRQWTPIENLIFSLSLSLFPTNEEEKLLYYSLAATTTEYYYELLCLVVVVVGRRRSNGRCRHYVTNISTSNKNEWIRRQLRWKLDSFCFWFQSLKWQTDRRTNRRSVSVAAIIQANSSIHPFVRSFVRLLTWQLKKAKPSIRSF